MVPPDPYNRTAETNPIAIADDPMEEKAILSETLPPERKRPWLIAVVAILFLVGGGLGWRWWQGRSGGQGEGAMQAQAAPVQLATVQNATIQEASEFVGTLESRNSVELRPEIDGRVSQIFVQPGDRVTAGTPLVQLSPEQRQAEYASVLASVNSARAIRANAQSEIQALQSERVASIAEVELQAENFRRTSTLVEQGALAQEQLDIVVRNQRTAIAALNAIDQRIQAARSSLAESEAALQAAQANAAASNAQLEDTVIRAPFAGTVGDIPVKLGTFVNAGDPLTTVTQSQALELEMSVPLERAPDLRTGQRVELLDAQGNPASIGQISFTSPQVNTAAQSILVKATFNNPQGRLLDGQFVRARLIWDERPGILVPTAAISRLGGQTFVFVAEQQEQPPAGQAPTGQLPAGQTPGGGQPAIVARQRLVQLGDIQGNNYQVLEGLQPGERIVISGVLNLAEGTPINPAPPSQGATPGQG